MKSIYIKIDTNQDSQALEPFITPAHPHFPNTHSLLSPHPAYRRAADTRESPKRNSFFAQTVSPMSAHSRGGKCDQQRKVVDLKWRLRPTRHILETNIYTQLLAATLIHRRICAQSHQQGEKNERLKHSLKHNKIGRAIKKRCAQ